MGLSTADRQRRYRERQRAVDGASVRLSTDLSIAAKARLERLARHGRESRRSALEKALRDAELALVSTLDPDAVDAYYGD